ncbi:MAG: hypothetical protein IPM46_00070 [Flavobacteriales bacterium]|nr:hypothetical protein [Flavobacteriales bacterium]
MNRQAAFFLVALAVLFGACLKDPIPDPLNSNPFDQDYTGTPLVEVTSTNSAVILDDDGLPIDTVMVFHFQVRTDLFPASTSYRAITRDPRDGSELTYQDDDQFARSIANVVIGQTYCMEAQLEVVGTTTRVWTHCAILQ